MKIMGKSLDELADLKKDTSFDTTSRRGFLQSLGCGFGSMALGGLFARETQGGSMVPHHPARARAVIQIFCPGGVSQVDTWDYKPGLAKRNGM